MRWPVRTLNMQREEQDGNKDREGQSMERKHHIELV